MSDVYVVLNISTTHSNFGLHGAKDSAEIIEIAWNIVDFKELKITESDAVLIRPANTPITQACTHQNGITWEHVRNSGSFSDAVKKLDSFIQDKIISKNLDFSFVTVESKKISLQLPREARDKSIAIPFYLSSPRVFDLRAEYIKWKSQSGDIDILQDVPLEKMASDLELEPSLEDSRIYLSSETFTGTELDSRGSYPKETLTAPTASLYSRILINLIKKTQDLENYANVLITPYDHGKDMMTFLDEKSKVLFLCNLPHDTTQAEVESWFTQYGGRPVSFWILKINDSHSNKNKQTNGYSKNVKQKSLSGFAVFATHEEASESLSMNGRIFNDRMVEVQPSSDSIIDKAHKLLAPFPTSRNKPRPGDWTCPSCGFSNFQRRTACFRCFFPVASAVTIQESMYGPQNQIRRPNIQGQNGTASENLVKPQGSISNNNLNRMNYDGHKNMDYQGYTTDKRPVHNMTQDGQITGHIGSYQSSQNNGNRYHHSYNVPFRAGDWKCIKESCQYHNFAKNICCLKCGSSKPSMSSQNSNMMQSHSINSMATAVAAATASGQSLNLSNNFMKMQQEQHYPTDHNPYQNYSNGSYAHVSNSNLSKTQLIMQLSQLQGKSNLNSPQILAQHYSMLQQNQNHHKSMQNISTPTSSSPGLYAQSGKNISIGSLGSSNSSISRPTLSNNEKSSSFEPSTDSWAPQMDHLNNSLRSLDLDSYQSYQ